MNFLHGVETIDIQDGARTVSEVKTAVIGLVGIAPTEYGKNTCILIKNDVDAAAYGKNVPGFDIPQALNILIGNGAGLIVVVNVFDIATHTADVVSEHQDVVNGKLKLAFPPIGAVTLKLADDVTNSPYILNTDYTLDEFGNFKVIAGRIVDATIISFTYKKLVAANVTSANIVGAVDGAGNRTGIKTFDLAFNQFGFRPKILIAPGRSATKAIADELIASAGRLRAITYVDGTYGENVQAAIADRGDATKAFGTSDSRAVPCYPYIKAYDASKDDGQPDTDTNTDYPYSMWLAGVTCARDSAFGYWWSPSNMPLQLATGVERPISANLNDPDTDANVLNGAGIVTVFNSFGTGYRSWGNRNASYPTNTQVDNFISLLRTFDVVHESLEQAALQFSDRPGTQAMIDDIRQSGNNFIKILIGRGALTEGSKVLYLQEDNSVANLAAGQYVFRIVKMGPTPAERITYKSIIDISLLKGLK